MKSFNDFIRELIPVCSKCGDYIMDANVGDEDLLDQFHSITVSVRVCKSCVRQEKLDDLLDE